jgi:hypothetical protein
MERHDGLVELLLDKTGWFASPIEFVVECKVKT